MAQLLAAIVAASVLLAVTAQNVCTTNEDCPADNTCISCGPTSICSPPAALGETCGAPLCPKQCASGLVCQVDAPPPFAPLLGSTAGLCCEPVECPSDCLPQDLVRTLDENGCHAACLCGHVEPPSTPEQPSLSGGKSPIDASNAMTDVATTCVVNEINARIYTQAEDHVALTSIVSGTQQLVAGMLYEMTISVHPAACVDACVQETFGARVLVQPWMQPSCTVLDLALGELGSAEDTTAAPVETSSSGDGLEKSTQMPVDESTPDPIVGGGSQITDLTSADVVDAALCAVSSMNAQSNAVYQLQLLRVLSGTSQIVAGTKYVLSIETAMSTTCLNNGAQPNLNACPVDVGSAATYTVQVVLQPWMQSSCTFLSSVQDITQDGSQSNGITTNPPSHPVLGGSTQITDLASADVVDAALCAVSSMNAQSNAVYQLQLLRVLSGTSQIVAGTKYVLSIETAMSTTCLNNGAQPNLNACPVDAGSAATYTVQVVVQPWMQPSCTFLSSVQGTTQDGSQSNGRTTNPPSHPVLGGSTQITDLASADVVDAALCAVSSMNAQSNAVYQLQLLRVLSGTSQIVAGTMYVLSIETAMSTTCLNNGAQPNLNACPVDVGSVATYSVEVLVQPWLQSSCNLLSSTPLTAVSSSNAPVVASIAPAANLTLNSDQSSTESHKSSSASMATIVLVSGLALCVVIVGVAIVIVKRNTPRSISYSRFDIDILDEALPSQTL